MKRLVSFLVFVTIFSSVSILFAQTAAELIKKGNQYKNSRNYTKAIEFYTKAIKVGPKEMIAYHNRGLLYFNLKDYANSIPDFSKAIELSPKSFFLYLERAKAYFETGDYANAKKDFQEAAKLGPVNEEKIKVYLDEIERKGF